MNTAKTKRVSAFDIQHSAFNRRSSAFCLPEAGRSLVDSTEGSLRLPSVFKSKGFTLIEIMVVVIIIGILLAIVAPRLIGRTDEAKVVQVKAQMKNFDTAIKLFKLDNGFYPSTEQGLEALVSKPTIGKIPENYTPGGYLEKKKVPLDPWNNYFVYIAPGLENSYDIICYGADGKPGGERYDADITNWD